MSDSNNQMDNNQYNQRIIDLNVNGYLMSLNTGLYCIYHVTNQIPADEYGFPGVRISVPPFKQDALVEIKTFENDGWLGAEKNAILVRISGQPGLILATVYQNPKNNHPSPQLQVLRLNDAPDIESFKSYSQEQMSELNKKIQEQSMSAAEQQKEEIAKEGKMRVVAHVQRLGDIAVEFGDWVGIPDSKTWIEGFGLSLDNRIQPDDIEYQAVLGKGWFSPWYKGNEFCGSRGMALPLCGLRVRLTSEAAKKFDMSLKATFIDGTKLGPVSDDTILSSETISPLEAFCLELKEKGKEDVDKDSVNNETLQEIDNQKDNDSDVFLTKIDVNKNANPRTNIKTPHHTHKNLSETNKNK